MLPTFEKMLEHEHSSMGRPVEYVDGFDWNEQIRFLIYRVQHAGNELTLGPNYPYLRWCVATETGWTAGIL